MSAHAKGFDVLVLCAEEFQPEAKLISSPRMRIIYAPNNDDGSSLTREQTRIAFEAGQKVAKCYRQGNAILVTCMMGRNRSGLVTCVALNLIFGISGRDAILHVRKTRGSEALSNRDFVRLLERLPAKRRRP